MFASIRNLIQDRRGISAVEYGVLGAGIVVVIVVAAELVGTNLTALLNGLATALT